MNTYQLAIIDQLKSFYKLNFNKSIFNKFFSKNNLKPAFYLYGGVGVGKTMILNFFFDVLNKKKLRQHFNEFILSFHNFAHENKEKNEENVINQFVKNLKSQTKLIYFDEFQVTNIVDAMILGKLFEVIFSENIRVILTTNIALNDLYKDGLQREQFLPFISVIKNNSIQTDSIINKKIKTTNGLTESIHKN